MKSCLALLFFLFVTVGSVMAAPQMLVEQLNYDFGEVLQGGKVEYTFRFSNTGDEVLEIGNVRSSCGCTAALLSARRIAPGDMGELRVTFNSTRFRGAVNKIITLESNDPQQSQVRFSVYGNVKAELLLEPERVKWGAVKRGQRLESKVIIRNLSSKLIQLQPPKSTSPVVSAKLSARQIPPAGQVELQLSAMLPEDKARLGGYVILVSDYPNQPQIRVPVSARLLK